MDRPSFKDPLWEYNLFNVSFTRKGRSWTKYRVSMDKWAFEKTLYEDISIFIIPYIEGIFQSIL